ncbi:MAG: outer membrane beta-barrel protein [Granulosicoccus sp.]
MKKIVTVSLVSCLAIASPIQAVADMYIGVDGASMSINSTQNDDLNPLGLRLRMGVRLNDFFDIEAHLGGGSDTESVSYDSFSTSFASALLKGYLPFGQKSAVFGLVGLSSLTHSQDINGRTFTDSQSGFSYGIGMETQLSSRVDLSADLMRYSADGAEFSDVTAVSFGLKWYF